MPRGSLWTAMHCEDPVLFFDSETHVLGGTRKARSDSRGPAWESTQTPGWVGRDDDCLGQHGGEGARSNATIENEASIELIDLRSISPWDRETVEESVRKTGRVIIVQEDTENCSVGQMVIAHLMSQPDLWSEIVSPPILVSKGNVMIVTIHL